MTRFAESTIVFPYQRSLRPVTGCQAAHHQILTDLASELMSE